MKTIRSRRETHDASKHGDKGKTHASWSSLKKGESSTVKEQPKSPIK